MSSKRHKKPRRRFTAAQVVLIVIAVSAVGKELVGLVRDLVKKPTAVVCHASASSARSDGRTSTSS